MKRLIVFVFMALAVLLSGCASHVQVLDGYYTAAGTTAQAASDLRLKRLKFELCATPFSAIVRNPEFFGAVRELCTVNNAIAVEDLLND